MRNPPDEVQTPSAFIEQLISGGSDPELATSSRQILTKHKKPLQIERIASDKNEIVNLALHSDRKRTGNDNDEDGGY